MKEIHKKLESAANVAILAVALVLIAGIAARYFSTPETINTQSVSRPRQETPDKATKFPLAGVDWSKSQKNLVLAFSTKCRFCLESIDFYKRIAERKAQQEDLRIIVVSYQPIDEVKSFFQKKNIEIDDYAHSELSDVSISGTPTLVLVGADGSVVDSWVGKLPPTTEAELLVRLSAEDR